MTSPEQIAQIVAMWPDNNLRISDIAERVGVTESVVRYYAAVHRLLPRKPGRKAFVGRVTSLLDAGLTYDQIAGLTGQSKEYLYQRVKYERSRHP